MCPESRGLSRVEPWSSSGKTGDRCERRLCVIYCKEIANMIEQSVKNGAAQSTNIPLRTGVNPPLSPQVCRSRGLRQGVEVRGKKRNSVTRSRRKKSEHSRPPGGSRPMKPQQEPFASARGNFITCLLQTSWFRLIITHLSFRCRRRSFWRSVQLWQ